MKRVFANRRLKPAPGQSGFTIVELMIALSVLSVLLLMSTLTLIGIGKLYSKGINEAATQNATRNITNSLASELELSGGTLNVPSGQSVICIGNQRYTYQLGHELTSSPTDHVLWHDTINGTSCSALPLGGAQPPHDNATVPGSGSEMLAVNMWLTDFNVAPGAGSLYNLKVSVAYGDASLLCDSGPPLGDCTSSGTSSRLVNHTGDIHCKGDVGNEYCAVSSLTTTVTRRLSN